jgi:steroid delta-isomerase-like uncharacterized protein
MAMTVTTEKLEASKKLARDYIDQVFNQHNPAKAADFVTGDVVWHGGALGDITGAENLAGLLGSFIGALPDLRAAERDIIAENDLVVVRLVVTATVKGSLLGVPADGKPVRWDAVDIYRVTDGKISEEWAADDIATIMAQVGAFNPRPRSNVRRLTWAAWRRPCWTRPCRRRAGGGDTRLSTQSRPGTRSGGHGLV